MRWGIAALVLTLTTRCCFGLRRERGHARARCAFLCGSHGTAAAGPGEEPRSVSDIRGGAVSELLLDAAGRRRSPATLPEFHAGRPPRNKGIRYPADPPTIEEIVTVMRRAGDRVHGRRLRGLIVVLWRAGHLRGGRAQARQPRPGRRPQANGTTRMSDDFFTRLERQLEAAELRELKRAPALRRIVSARRLLSVPLAAAAAVGVVVVVLAVLGAIDTNDADRRPQPAGTVPAPRMEVVVTDVERGLRFGLDERVLTVQLLPPVLNQTF